MKQYRELSSSDSSQDSCDTEGTEEWPSRVARPPVELNGRDKSVKKKDKIFGVSLDVNGAELRKCLSPPDVSEKMALEMTEAMTDVVNLGGKPSNNHEVEDTAVNIQDSLFEIAAVSRQERLGEESRRDLRWKNGSRNGFKGVKNLDGLRTLLYDVRSLQDTNTSNLIAIQLAILQRKGWDSLITEAWCHGGYITTLSRLGMRNYIDLLEHLVHVGSSSTWSMVKKEIDYHVKKWSMIRASSNTRVGAICGIYVHLRDGSVSKWIYNTLEAEKTSELYKTVSNGSGGNPGSGTRGLAVCSKCGTILHGDTGCIWANKTNNQAKQAARDVIRALANGQA
ncbi:hypothetical protein SEMRO_449_G145240.1 [Seminavis robusta]|uniref:Uncharacterized protein n=1 Tax=Seminavis robusta TaxID=568900 RepID=A0A9N8DXE5_9STRA|nr:hypothetical protein SEMRO_449_G145240.1 [Seminavis robusta]|eukprot:Sro449_g145240.1 n/a (338) ;mRNA; r:14171-15184